MSPEKRRTVNIRLIALVLPMAALAALLIHHSSTNAQTESVSPPYGLNERIPPSDIDLPIDMPVLRDWKTVDAFPNLTFEAPMWVTSPKNDDRFLYVVERRGRIERFENRVDAHEKHLVIDIGESVGRVEGEEGVAGMTFHPKFGDGDHNFIYIAHTAKANGKRYNRLTRFTIPDAENPVADQDSEFIMIDQEDESSWHNLGAVDFGQDGFLYLAIGDEGDGRDKLKNGQIINKDLFSGMLRIDVDMQGGDISHPPKRQPRTGKTQGYYIPNDNPFVDVPDALGEFYSIGMRNPWRWSWDRETGTLWAGVVGQTQREIIVHVTKGSNHGWSYREGTRPANLTRYRGKKPRAFYGEDVMPFHEYVRGAVIGGYVYRGKQFPELQGKYIFGDNLRSRIFVMAFNEDGAESIKEMDDLPGSSYRGFVSFSELPDGELLLISAGGKGEDKGRIQKLERTDWQTGPTLPEKLSQTGIFQDLSTLTPKASFVPYEPNSPFWSDRAAKSRWIAVPGDGSSSDSSKDRITFTETGDWSFPNGTIFLKHFDLNTDLTDPNQRIRLETRVIVQTNEGEFYAMTYRWNDEQTDADLVLEATPYDIPITQEDGTSGTQPWLFPSPSQCMECHNDAAPVLGVSTRQLNGMYDYPNGKTAHQLGTWNHLGLFDKDLDESKFKDMHALVHVSETDQDINRRFQSYLDSNCSQCHRPDSWMGNYFFDARYETPIQQSNVLDPKIWNSIEERINSTREHEVMPPIGRFLTDHQAVAMMNEWTQSLTPDWVVLLLMLVGIGVPVVLFTLTPQPVTNVTNTNESSGVMMSGWPIRLFALLLIGWVGAMIFAARTDALYGWFKQLPLAWVMPASLGGVGTLLLILPPTIKRLGHVSLWRLHGLMAMRFAGISMFAVHAWKLIPEPWLTLAWVDIGFGAVAIGLAAMLGSNPSRGKLWLAVLFNLMALVAFLAWPKILLDTHPVRPTFQYPLVMLLVIYLPISYLLHMMALLSALMRLRLLNRGA